MSYADETRAPYLGADKEKNGLSAINNYYRYLLNNAKRLVVVIANTFASHTHTRAHARARTHTHAHTHTLSLSLIKFYIM